MGTKGWPVLYSNNALCLHFFSIDFNVSFTAPVYQLLKGYSQSDKVCLKKKKAKDRGR